MTPRPTRLSQRLSDEQVALLSAALRHARDAERLLDDPACRSVDQAWHLAGFGPECARKAFLAERWADHPLGHQLGDTATDVLDFAVALDPTAWRLGMPRTGLDAELTSWDPTVRYDRTGAADELATRLAVRSARTSVDSAVASLWSAGLLAAIPE